jgi:hypothetical protein
VGFAARARFALLDQKWPKTSVVGVWRR